MKWIQFINMIWTRARHFPNLDCTHLYRLYGVCVRVYECVCVRVFVVDLCNRILLYGPSHAKETFHFPYWFCRMNIESKAFCRPWFSRMFVFLCFNFVLSQIEYKSQCCFRNWSYKIVSMPMHDNVVCLCRFINELSQWWEIDMAKREKWRPH